MINPVAEHRVRCDITRAVADRADLRVGGHRLGGARSTAAAGVRP